MKILIIGKNSYIGNHIDEWLTKYGHEVEQLDVLTEDWKAYDYSPYDAIVHVAGIVHRRDCQDWKLYHDVNTVMPVQIASLFKSSRSMKGLRGQYVFFSTMGVYDAGKKLSPSVVDENTPLLNEGNSMYGRSKAMAEEALLALQSSKGSLQAKRPDGPSASSSNCSTLEQLDSALNQAQAIEPLEHATFNVAIVRPPSVYGKGCKGGYITGFKKIASVLPVIPRAYENACQSFIYIDNLSECVRLIVENSSICSSGSNVFCPQDDEIPNANRLLEVICKSIGKKYRCSKILGWLIEMVNGSICSKGSRGWIPLVKKAYGGIEYSRKLSDIPGMNYVVVPFEEGMKRTVS